MSRTFDTITRASFLGVDISRVRTHTVVDAGTGRTLEYQSLSPKRGRHYVFGETGYTVKKLRPSHGFDAPIDEWEVKSMLRPESNELAILFHSRVERVLALASAARRFRSARARRRGAVPRRHLEGAAGLPRQRRRGARAGPLVHRPAP